MSKLVAVKSILACYFSLKGLRKRSEISVLTTVMSRIFRTRKKNPIIQESPDIYLMWLASVARFYKVMCKN